MAFLIQCNNYKTCGKYQEPLLDVATNKVHCADCDGEITNITHFTKVQMKSLGQTKKANKKKQAFAVKCGVCNMEVQPKVVNGNVCCEKCSNKLNLSKPFEKVIKDFYKM